jgi:signal transduction histidine kinase
VGGIDEGRRGTSAIPTFVGCRVADPFLVLRSMAVWARAAATWERIGPRARDVVFVVIALLAAAAETLARRHGPVLAMVLIGGAAFAGAVALWWRRRYPVAVTLIGLGVFAATGGSLPVVAAVGLTTLAVRRRDRVLAAVTVAAIATVVAVGLVANDQDWRELVALAAIEAGFCVALGAFVGARRDLVAALRERAERAEAEQELRAEQARLAERARIAREMHDVLAHKVSLIAMHAGALEVQRAPDPEQVARTAGLIRTTAREAMEDLREVLGVLRADAVDGADLAPPPRRDDIARVVDASRAAGVQAELRMDVDELPDALARTAHRVVQEGLTNVHKHARGAATVVTVAGRPCAGLHVEVVNCRPVGVAALLPGSGAGLSGLAERVGLLGGTLESGPSADGGWRLAAWLPWSPA